MKRGKTLATKTCLVSSTGFLDQSRSMARKTKAITQLKISLASKKTPVYIEIQLWLRKWIAKGLGRVVRRLVYEKKSCGKKPKAKNIFLITEFWKGLL